MIFTTLSFVAFFIVVWIAHWLLPRSWRRPWLLLASYWFYLQAIPLYGILMLAQTVVNYLGGRALWRAQGRWRRAALVALIALNLGTLAFFKYAELAARSLWSLLARFPGHAANPPNLGILLPLGISFFTFEFIHYQVEVARGTEPIRQPLDFALFAAFFPTQIAGPIKRFPDWVKQLRHPVAFRDIQADTALSLILRGAAKKITLADTLAPLVAAAFDRPSHLGIATAWLAILAFTAQIYGDFSGYTDIGRGCALALGYTVPENFLAPYQARNPSEFWDRWHRSLSRWLRDYLYIPLGGSRASARRVTLNLLITMALGGLWHGASWHFMLWGVYQGSLLVVHRLWAGGLARVGWAGRLTATAPGIALGRVVTFALICLGWVIFRANSTWSGASMLGEALWPGGRAAWAGLGQLAAPGGLALPLIVLGVAGAVMLRGWLWDLARGVWPALSGLPTRCQPTLLRAAPIWRPGLAVAGIALVAIWPQGGTVRFIYFQF